jgi:hypothetical protein
MTPPKIVPEELVSRGSIDPNRRFTKRIGDFVHWAIMLADTQSSNNDDQPETDVYRRSLRRQLFAVR